MIEPKLAAVLGRRHALGRVSPAVVVHQLADDRHEARRVDQLLPRRAPEPHAPLEVLARLSQVVLPLGLRELLPSARLLLGLRRHALVVVAVEPRDELRIDGIFHD